MSWSTKIQPDPIGECDIAYYYDDKIIPKQLIDFGLRGRTKSSFGIFADHKIKGCLTDKEIKSLPTWNFLFFEQDEMRCCKIWIEL